MNPVPPSTDDPQVRRARARRTVLVMVAIAVAIYVAFILSGVLAS